MSRIRTPARCRPGSSNLIGVIIFNLKNEFPSALLTSIEAEASRRGYSTLIMLSNYSEKTERDCVTRMRSMNVAGIIAMSVVTDSGYYESLIHGGTRIVAVGNRIVGDIPYVGIDDRAAMRASTEYVLARGYERLVYVAPLLEKAATQNIGAQSERFSGFLDAIGLTEAKLDSTEPDSMPLGSNTRSSTAMTATNGVSRNVRNPPAARRSSARATPTR